MNKERQLYDCRGFGQALKHAREERGWTREQLAEIVDLAPRYIMSIENKGQHPSLQVFYELATLFHISVDPFFFPEDPATQSPRRRQLNADLDTLSESDLLIIKAAIDGIRRAKAESAQ